MASYTFTSTDGRIAHAVLRGRQLASSDITGRISFNKPGALS